MGVKSITTSWLTVVAVVFTGALVAALGMTLGAGKAWAGVANPYEFPTLEDLTHKTYTVSYKGKGIDMGFHSYSSSKNYGKKISNAKSSDESVATVSVFHDKDGSWNYYSLEVNIKKAGTTNISFKWGGKKYAVKYKVVPYANPVKSYKIGSMDLTKKFAPKALKKMTVSTDLIATTKAKSYSGKVVIKPAKGWKVKKIFYFKKVGKGVSATIVKNGGKVRGAKQIHVIMVKGRQKEFLRVDPKSLRSQSVQSQSLQAANVQLRAA